MASGCCVGLYIEAVFVQIRLHQILGMIIRLKTGCSQMGKAVSLSEIIHAVGKSKISLYISTHYGFLLSCFVFLPEPGYVATPIAMVQAGVSLLEDTACLPKQ